MADKLFAKRLREACDGHPHIPAYGQGRQEWIRQKLGVSSEASRKYFAGLSRPKPDKMRVLAKILEVDEAWLSLGIVPDMSPAEKRERNAQADGAVNVVAGLIQLNSGHIAFPGDRDPRAEYVDMYAIMRGQQYAIHVSLAKQISPDVFKFTIPKEYEQCKVVGVVHVYQTRVHMVNLTEELITKHKSRKGGYFEVTVNKIGSDYHSGSDKWPRIQLLTDRL